MASMTHNVTTAMYGRSTLAALQARPVPEQIQDFIKAIAAGAGVNAAAFAGGRALQPEFLDTMLYDTALRMDQLALWPLLFKKPATSTVVQWNERSAFGANFRGRAVRGAENPNENTATINRRNGEIAFYRDLRGVEHPATIVNMAGGITAEAEETEAGTEVLLQNVERDLFLGDHTMVAEEFDGIWRQVQTSGDADQIIDAAGQPINSKDWFRQSASLIRGNAGFATHAFLSIDDQDDLDAVFDPNERVSIPVQRADGRIAYGATVGSLRTTHGELVFMPSVFLPAGETCPAAVDPGSGLPAQPVLALAAAGADANDVNMPVGAYFYHVRARNRFGASAPSAGIAAQAKAATQHITLTMTTADPTTTCYDIYRSARNAADTSDCRYLTTVAYTGLVQTYDDVGADIPGTTKMFIGNFKRDAIRVDQLLPLQKLPLAITQPSLPFLLMLYLRLTITKPRQFVVIRNVLPTNLNWTPI